MSIIENTNNAINSSATIGEICAHVAIGGTLVEYCKRNDLHFKLIVAWIGEDETRAKHYASALDIREQHAKDLIIAELICYLKANLTDAFTVVEGEHGNMQAMKDIQDMPPELQRLISSIEFEELFEWQGSGKEREKVHVGRMHKIKFWDKPRSIETFMKHLAMLVDRKQVDVTMSLADLVAGSFDKPKEELPL